MIVVKDIDSLEKDIRSIVTIGVFDGLHIGHQEIMRIVKNESYSGRYKSVAVTFDVNPKELVRHNKSASHISTLSHKLKLIEKQMIDMAIILPSNKEILSLSPEEFIEKFIVNRLSAIKVVVGADFAFGKNRSGNTETLKKIGNELNFQTIVVPPVMSNNHIVSSTNIRKIIANGDVEIAAKLLARPFVFEGIVVHGQKIGRTIGFPTVNIMPIEKQVVPGKGIYSVLVNIDGNIKVGVCNIGTRPTVAGVSTEVEVHILDFKEDIYDHKIDIAFVKFLRNEIKFAGLDDLVKQINCDIEMTNKTLNFDETIKQIIW